MDNQYRLRSPLLYLFIVVMCSYSLLNAQVNERIAKISIEEKAGLTRDLQYIQVDVQVGGKVAFNISAEDVATGKSVPCQTFARLDREDENITILTVIFPVALESYEKKIIILRKDEKKQAVDTDLRISGEKTELIIENSYYRADLRRSEDSEPKSHYSGQLRELFVKMNFNVLFLRTENRMHWAPNFRKKGMENYTTIAEWEKPHTNNIYQGPYCIITERQDFAAGIQEILLSASYKFYARLPYFVFSSVMEVVNDVWLDWLINDEMTMDSLFTHIAYQAHDKTIIDLPLATRQSVLKNEPVPADAPWLCFYNEKTGYAFGSIRIAYNNRNEFGHRSPTFKPHTKISDGDGGGKYWNRALIDRFPLLVPSGSRYYEQNAYLVFETDVQQKFRHIEYWSARLRNPPGVSVIQNYK